MLKLAKAPYDSLQEFFRADRWGIPPAVEYNASEITIRHLLAMTSGIRDFDTNGYRDFQYQSPHLDTSPLQILDWVHGPLMFKPGGPIPQVGSHGPSSMNYCSVNFILLGYILAYFSGSHSWSEYDQSSVIPSAVRKLMPGVKFAKSGSCSHFTRVHGYDQALKYAPYDVSNTSCLGGWTAGNIVMPSLAAAEWTRALWGTSYEILPNKYIQEMTRFANGSFYGLATMDMTFMNGLSFLGPYGYAVGHLGDTYGFTSLISYFPKLDVGLAIATNHESEQQPGPRALLCTAYNRALDIMLRQPIRECSYVQGSYWESGCNCSSDLGNLGAEIIV
jgi:CubicO group peptidase (beta-lactamase class C family)